MTRKVGGGASAQFRGRYLWTIPKLNLWRRWHRTDLNTKVQNTVNWSNITRDRKEWKQTLLEMKSLRNSVKCGGRNPSKTVLDRRMFTGLLKYFRQDQPDLLPQSRSSCQIIIIELTVPGWGPDGKCALKRYQCQGYNNVVDVCDLEVVYVI